VQKGISVIGSNFIYTYMFRLHLFLFLSIQLFSLHSHAQVGLNSEEEQKKSAHALFVSGQYGKAAPLYAQLISNHPEDTGYNYYYGVSLLLSSKNKNEAEKQLEIAAAFKGSPSLVYYYLGKAYHLNYDFDKAVAAFEYFKKIAKPSEYKDLNVDLLLIMCNNAKKFDFSGSNSAIVSMNETDEEMFSSLYNFNKNSGKFLAIPEKFIKGKSSKEKFDKYVYFSPTGKTLIFSGPGKSNSTEIFISKRKSGNEWGDPEPVKFESVIPGDKINPTISEDGKIIYFGWNSAKSIGGFDIFQSSFISETGKWSEPENMGTPANSPDDDYYYLPSREEGIAFLCSKRNCDEGKINVISIKLDEKKILTPVEQTSINADNNKPEITFITLKSIPPSHEIKISVANIPFHLERNEKKSNAFSLKEIIANEERENKIGENNTDSDNMKETVASQIKTKSITVKGVFYSLDKPLSMNAEVIAVNIGNPDKKYYAETNPKTGEYVLHLLQEGNYKFSVEKEGYTNLEQTVKVEKENCSEIKQQIIIDKNKKGEEHFAVMSVNAKNQDPKSDKIFSSKEANANSSAKNFSHDSLTFKIQIGAFLLKPVEEVFKKFEDAGITDVTFITKENGMHVFYTGDTNDFFTALTKRKEVIEKGFGDAFIAAFLGSTPVSVEDALLSYK
jgi:hypothetical protein